MPRGVDAVDHWSSKRRPLHREQIDRTLDERGAGRVGGRQVDEPGIDLGDQYDLPLFHYHTLSDSLRHGGNWVHTDDEGGGSNHPRTERAGPDRQVSCSADIDERPYVAPATTRRQRLAVNLYHGSSEVCERFLLRQACHRIPIPRSARRSEVAVRAAGARHLGKIGDVSTRADVTAAVVAQWRQAGAALAQVRRDELRRLTDAEALVAADELLDLVRLLPPATGTSGLVEQQRLFARAHS